MNFIVRQSESIRVPLLEWRMQGRGRKASQNYFVPYIFLSLSLISSSQTMRLLELKCKGLEGD